MRTFLSNLIYLRTVVPFAALALTFGACRCGPPPTTEIRPDVVPSPAALSFEACPSMDENGNAVEDVFPDRQVITLTNQTNIGAPLTLTLTGAGAERFTLVDPPEFIDAQGEVEVTVDFLPSAQGDTTATLEVEDGDPQTELVKVTLVGTGTNLPAQPTMQVAYETAPGSNEFADCVEGLFCAPDFPQTRYGETSTLRVRVRNLGCPALKITGMSMEPSAFGSGAMAYFLDEPVVPPSADNPMLLTIADGTQELEAVVRFEPTPDDSGDDQRYANLVITTNDPRQDPTEGSAGVRTLSLFGMGVQPSLYATPSYCDFTNPDDTCGGTKVPTTGNNKLAVFQITNGGGADVTIESIRVVGPNGNRFSVGQQNPLGMVIPANGGSAPLQIDYTDAPTYVIDFIEIVAADGMGDTKIRVSGGEQPRLYTDTEPNRELNFSSITEQTGSLPVEICNEVGAGTLVINSLAVLPANQQFFKVPSPPAAGTQIAGGDCITVNVQFTRPVSGGLQAATLNINSNDPRYAPYTITLLSEAPLNEYPVAVLESISGQDNQFAVSLQALGLTPRITLNGAKSYDPPNNDPVTEYMYYIQSKPNNATARLTEDNNIMSPNIDGVRGTVTEPRLHLDPDRTGLYVVRLLVFDSSGQKSPVPSELRILVNP